MAKVLVIDDDPAIVDLLKIQLDALGHSVVVAFDANAAAMIGAKEKPDLITLDFSMPAGDGSKALQRLRLNGVNQRTPVIVITGMAKHDLPPMLQNAFAVKFLQKPIDLGELKKLVDESLGISPAPPPAAAPAPAPAAPPVKAPEPPPDDAGGTVLDLDS